MVGFRSFYVKLRKDLDPRTELKNKVREKGVVHFSPQAFRKKKTYPVLAVDLDCSTVESLAGEATQRQTMLLLPDDYGCIVWVDSHFFHFAGLKDKKSS